MRDALPPRQVGQCLLHQQLHNNAVRDSLDTATSRHTGIGHKVIRLPLLRHSIIIPTRTISALGGIVVVLLIYYNRKLQREVDELRVERNREAEVATHYRYLYCKLLQACARGPPTRSPPPLPDYEHLTF